MDLWNVTFWVAVAAAVIIITNIALTLLLDGIYGKKTLPCPKYKSIKIPGNSRPVWIDFVQHVIQLPIFVIAVIFILIIRPPIAQTQ